MYDLIEDMYITGSELSEKGSNSWVIHGDYTKSGKPLLANDPHLDNSMPSIWYPLELVYSQNEYVHGVSFAGIPLIFIGFTHILILNNK